MYKKLVGWFLKCHVRCLLRKKAAVITIAVDVGLIPKFTPITALFACMTNLNRVDYC